jgi:hypothetical protein
MCNAQDRALARTREHFLLKLPPNSVKLRVVLYVSDMCAGHKASEMSVDVVPNLIYCISRTPGALVPYGHSASLVWSL